MCTRSKTVRHQQYQLYSIITHTTRNIQKLYNIASIVENHCLTTCIFGETRRHVHCAPVRNVKIPHSDNSKDSFKCTLLVIHGIVNSNIDRWKLYVRKL